MTKSDVVMLNDVTCTLGQGYAHSGRLTKHAIWCNGCGDWLDLHFPSKARARSAARQHILTEHLDWDD